MNAAAVARVGDGKFFTGVRRLVAILRCAEACGDFNASEKLCLVVNAGDTMLCVGHAGEDDTNI